MIGHGTGECRALAEVMKQPSPIPKGQREIQQKRGGKPQTKWIAEPKPTVEVQGKEVNKEQVTTTIQEVVTTGSENKENEEF